MPKTSSIRPVVLMEIGKHQLVIDTETYTGLVCASIWKILRRHVRYDKSCYFHVRSKADKSEQIDTIQNYKHNSLQNDYHYDHFNSLSYLFNKNTVTSLHYLGVV